MVVRNSILVVILALFSFHALSAQAVRVTSRVQESTISLSERLNLILEISSDSQVRIKEPPAPKIKSFAFVNVNESSSSRVSIINGRTTGSYSQIFTYSYMPQAKGSFTIPGFKVRVGSKDYNTSEQKVVVTDSRTPPNPNSGFQGNPYNWNRAGGESFLLCIPEQSRVYLGQPVQVSYYLYTDQMVESFSSNGEKDHGGYGKSLLEQPTTLDYRDVTYNGRRFQRALIKSIAIYPQVTGRLQMPTIQGIVRFSGYYSFLNRNLNSEDTWIEAVSLPAGKPAGYTGAVGDFTVSQSFSDNELHLGEALQCTVKISGKGNFSQFAATPYPRADKFQISAPNVEDRLSDPITGTRYIQFTIVPTVTGDLKLPGYIFNWLNPNSGAYQSFSGSAHNVKVKPAGASSLFSGLLKKDKPRSLHPLLKVTKYPNFKLYTSSWWFWLLIAMCLASLLFSAYYYRQRTLQQRDPVAYEQEQARRILNKYLSQAVAAARNDSAEFHALAEQGLTAFLSKKFGISQSLSTQEFIHELSARGVGDDLSSRLELFLRNCQSARFAPPRSATSELGNELSELQDIVLAFTSLNKTKRLNLSLKPKTPQNGAEH